MVRELKVVTDEFVTVPEAAKQLGKPKMTLYRWIGANKLIAVTFGGILFIPKSEVERLKRERNNQATGVEPVA
ncbi:hypothetical protein ES708_26826 [subsurface metagenome]